MQKITSTSELQDAISVLEYKQKEQWDEFKGNLNSAFDSLKPVNIIKSTYKDFVSTPNLVQGIMASAIGMGTGFLTKKFIVRRSGNILRNLLGGVAQRVISTVVSRNSGVIKNIGAGLLSRVLTRKATKSIGT